MQRTLNETKKCPERSLARIARRKARGLAACSRRGADLHLKKDNANTRNMYAQLTRDCRAESGITPKFCGSISAALGSFWPPTDPPAQLHVLSSSSVMSVRMAQKKTQTAPVSMQVVYCVWRSYEACFATGSPLHPACCSCASPLSRLHQQGQFIGWVQTGQIPDLALLQTMCTVQISGHAGTTTPEGGAVSSSRTQKHGTPLAVTRYQTHKTQSS